MYTSIDLTNDPQSTVDVGHHHSTVTGIENYDIRLTDGDGNWVAASLREDQAEVLMRKLTDKITARRLARQLLQRETGGAA